MILEILNYLIPAILLALFLLQILKREFFASHISAIFWLCVAIVFAFLTYASINQYFTWLNDGVASKYLLPPYASISYFLFYILTRIWLPYLLSLAFAGIAFLSAKYLNKKFEERFFFQEEYYLIALGFFLSVHPFWIGFLMLVALSYLIYSIIVTLKTSGTQRASFYYLWIPATLIISLLMPWLMTFSFLTVLKV
jgi:hypothetical protein